MESLNKVLTVVLGLIVVMVLLAVLTSKLKIGREGIFSFRPAEKITPVPTGRVDTISPTKAPRKGFFSFLNRPKSTPTPPVKSIAASPKPGQSKGGIFSFMSKPRLTTTPSPTPTISSTQTKGVRSIPKTGPELLLPLAAVAFTTGIYLRKRK